MDKVNTIRKQKTPTKTKDIKRFVGFTNYY